MKSITCDVRDNDRDTTTRTDVDGLAALPPTPTNIKEQMPLLAAMLKDLAAQLGRERIQFQLKASMDLRKAFDADDYREVNSIYRRGHGWIDWQEAGFCLSLIHI